MSFDPAHPDLLDDLNKKASLAEKLACIHRATRKCCDFIHRIGVAVYDSQCDTLKTFAHSTDGDNPLPHYQAKLSEATSLYQVYQNGKPRVVNDLSIFNAHDGEHTRNIRAQGFLSSYTIPMFQDSQLTGFVFFNSRELGVFKEEQLLYLDMIARLISLLVNAELNKVKTLRGALKTATSFSRHKDPETGAHLERMARIARLIANGIAADRGLSDEFVETIFWFAPMHDIGKIAIPDRIITKPGQLTDEEFALMKTHTTKGREIIDTMLGHFNLVDPGNASMLGNIAECHHENMDGSGYPNGLTGEDIPIEARIIAVADVFDALTSNRCYKPAWSNEAAFEELDSLSRWKLDPRCVDILFDNHAKLREIQTQFKDELETSKSTH